MWFQDEQDWGTGNDNDGNGNADNFNLAPSSSQLYLDNMAKTTTSGGGSGGGGSDNLNNMNSNTTSSITDVVQKMENKLNIIEVSGHWQGVGLFIGSPPFKFRK